MSRCTRRRTAPSRTQMIVSLRTHSAADHTVLFRESRVRLLSHAFCPTASDCSLRLAAHRRRDSPGSAHRTRHGGEEIWAVFKDHRRAACRSVWSTGAPTPFYLEGTVSYFSRFVLLSSRENLKDITLQNRCRIRKRACLRQGAADRQVLRRLDMVPLRDRRLGWFRCEGRRAVPRHQSAA